VLSKPWRAFCVPALTSQAEFAIESFFSMIQRILQRKSWVLDQEHKRMLQTRTHLARFSFFGR
jgi:hypothetical protein